MEIVPAERPAMVSTNAGENRAWLSVIRENAGVGAIVKRHWRCKADLEIF